MSVPKPSTRPYEVERWAMDQNVRTAQGKLILIIMSVDASAQGHAWTRQKVIAERAQCSRQCVNEWFAEFEENGRLATRPRYRDDGGKRSKEWILLFRDGLTWPDGTPAVPHVNQDDMGDPHVNGGRHGYVNGGRHGMSTTDDMGMSTTDDIMKRKNEETEEEPEGRTPPPPPSGGLAESEHQQPAEDSSSATQPHQPHAARCAPPRDSAESADTPVTSDLILMYLDWKRPQYPEKAGLRKGDIKENSAEWTTQIEAVNPSVTPDEFRAALDTASGKLASAGKKEREGLDLALGGRNGIATILAYVDKARTQSVPNRDHTSHSSHTSHKQPPGSIPFDASVYSETHVVDQNGRSIKLHAKPGDDARYHLMHGYLFLANMSKLGVSAMMAKSAFAKV